MTEKLTFSGSNFLKGELTSSSPNGIGYQIFSHEKWKSPVATVLTPVEPDDKDAKVIPGPSGTIDWKKRDFTIGEDLRSWDDIKSRPGGIWSTPREWKWSGMSYTVDFSYKKNRWEAKPSKQLVDGGDPQPIATFNPYRAHLFHPNEPAYIELTGDVPVEDHLFLIMIFQYSERKRQTQQAAAAASAGAAASSSAGAAAAAC